MTGAQRSSTTGAQRSSNVVKLAERRRLTLADLTADECGGLCTAVHESGHAIVGVLHGGHLHSAEWFGGREVNGRHGLTVFRGDLPGRNSEMLLAGPVAEARWCAGGRRSPSAMELDRVLTSSGCFDHAAITAAGRGIANVDEMRADVAALVATAWDAVLDVARAIHSRAEPVDHATVCAALNIPATGNEHHRALIRSGRAPGSFSIQKGIA